MYCHAKYCQQWRRPTSKMPVKHKENKIKPQHVLSSSRPAIPRISIFPWLYSCLRYSTHVSMEIFMFTLLKPCFHGDIHVYATQPMFPWRYSCLRYSTHVSMEIFMFTLLSQCFHGDIHVYATQPMYTPLKAAKEFIKTI